MTMLSRRDTIYAELGVPPPEPEDALDAWERLKPKPEPKARGPQLDTRSPTMAEIDALIGQRIAAEHRFMMDILAELLAHLQHDATMRGPPGSEGPRGEQGPPGKLPMVKPWAPETVYYEGEVVGHDGATFQAKRDTGQPPTHRDWICLTTAGREEAKLVLAANRASQV
jgi:hypothetical protein